MRLESFFKIFDRLADAPGSIEKLRQLVLDLAVNGRLVTPEAEWARRPLKSLATKIGSGATPAVWTRVLLLRRNPFDSFHERSLQRVRPDWASILER